MTDDIQKRINKESLSLFKKYGINYVTMDMIANNLGISKKTIYVYYSSKKDLIIQVLTAFMDSKRAHFEQIAGSSNVIEGIVKMVKELSKELNEFNPNLFEELKRHYPDVAKIVDESRWVNDYNNMNNLIESGKSQKLIRKEVNTDIAAKLLLAQLQYININEIFPISEYPRSELFEHIFVNFIRGIATNKGMEIMDNLNM